jgi:hypothetical protein
MKLHSRQISDIKAKQTLLIPELVLIEAKQTLLILHHKKIEA